MDNATPIIIKRGFFSTLAKGICGVLITGILCGTGLGLYGMRMVDRKTSDLTGLGKELVAAVPGIIEALPPALSDALNDRRDPGYRSKLDIDVLRVAQDERSRWTRPILSVTNAGDETVSLLALRVVLVDDEGLPVDECTTFAATPLACENDWRGPLLPGQTRKFATHLYTRQENLSAEVEVTELRLWNGPESVDLAGRDD